ncbi:hypothetical protein GALMADRAFT_52149 [Galerina marginata CBS 339.88]|uniref:Copper acquisition factor BIM1-like domain-containing protein n=1 Tax=Galerina marginata (strain CBS 339.88) TaxID=685588 RepID=A0A067TNE5_GALM3|nr:hypothetical protein GALMADRAFT_52149 [Galerina marginata CBS 339.88]
MMFSTLTFLLCLFGTAHAHFRLLYPGPRGDFVADTEPNFCGGYTEVTTNRTTFPLSGGFFIIKTGHPDWTAGVLISTIQSPNSFDNFSVNGVQQLVSPYAKAPNPGTFCIPLNISAANIPGAKDGANVTIQIVFQGGDGNLYQCADLTLSGNLTRPPSDLTCANATTTSSAPASTPTAPSSTSASLSLAHELSAYAAVLMSALGVLASIQ